MIQFRRGRARDGSAPSGFVPGDLVRHRRYGYRGVVVDVDLECKASQRWYESNRTQPRRDQPWYHVLIDGADHSTYAAEDSLMPDYSPVEVRHPLVGLYFSGFEDGLYTRNDRPWEFGAP